ncbi:MAG TPA: hypothetical protein VN924_00390 [Bryobacteraceae bacterium]|jgi:hypothetical protein|nr:hypothetical protein [Bryobacteraceae bacterium]
MNTLTLILGALLFGPSDPVPAPAPPAARASSSASETDPLRQLLTVRRVFVDRFSGGETAAQLRDMIINGLQGSKLFTITENQEKADAILRGSGEDLVFNETHSSSDSLEVHSNTSSSQSEEDTALRGGTRSDDRATRSMGLGAGNSESSRSVERRHEANAAVRLVTKDGDVIWSTTQESMGGKFRGASSDVADKIAKQLTEDYERAKTLPH